MRRSRPDLTPAQLLLYRSNLLGSDKRITNFGGGNTSAKVIAKDPLTGKDVQVLWVKGSGGDLGTMKLDGFATLYMEKFLSLEPFYKGSDSDSVLVPLYSHCTFNLNPRAASIDTPLHGLVDRAHVDHMHPDALIAIAAAADSRALTKEIYGDEVGWLPWIRPGYELGLALRKFTRENPKARGVVLEAHGVFTWADTAKACYENTLDVINRATVWLAEKSRGKQPFGAIKTQPLSPEKRREVAAAIMPRIRGLISGDDAQGRSLRRQRGGAGIRGQRKAAGARRPRHVLPRSFPAHQDLAAGVAVRCRQRIGRAVHSLAFSPAIEQYRERYAAYYERCKRPGSPKMRDPNAVVYLVPGVGMITFAADKATARIAGEFYINAINVMRGAAAVSTYRGLPEQEAFDIEYWDLEEAKLQRMPKPKPLAGRVALITGGAGGIGLATARRLMDEGACVMLCDIDRDALREAEAGLKKQYGADVVVQLLGGRDAGRRRDRQLPRQRLEVRRPRHLHFQRRHRLRLAGRSRPRLATWQKNMDILSTGYFLVARQAFQLLKAQGIGGSIVFIGSKNALAASPGAAAYCTAKAAELHLARCLALEGAPSGIRVNVVNPDAVLRGSRIWQGEWAQQRAEQYKTSPDELEAIYRERSLLKRSVYPEDVAEAVAFFASERSAKSTGNIINVDAGNAAAFTR